MVSMEIRVEELKQAGSLEINYLENPAELEINALNALNVSLLLKYQGESVTINGTIEGTVILDCSRCLEDFSYPIRSEVNLKLSLFQTPMKTLNLTDEIRQTIILDLPIKPLCHDSCKGLCPRCGQNLNLKECNCQEKIMDPRLEKLKSFKVEKR